MKDSSTFADSFGSSLSIGAIIQALWYRKVLIVSAMLLSGAALYVVGTFITPVYRATIVVVPANPEQTAAGAFSAGLGQLGGLASLAGISMGFDSSGPEEALAILRSRSFTEEFIVEHELIGQLFPETEPGIVARLLRRTARPSLADASFFFDQGVRRVFQDARTGLIEISIRWFDPVLAANWANALIGDLNREMRDRAIRNADASIVYLQQALADETLIETRQAIGRLMETQVNRSMLATVTQEYALRVVDVALPSDLDDPVHPNKRLLVALGLLLGGALGCTVALIFPRKAGQFSAK